MKKRNLVSYIAILMAIGFIIAVVGIIIDGQVMQKSYETTAAQSYGISCNGSICFPCVSCGNNMYEWTTSVEVV